MLFSAQHRDHGDIMETGINSETTEELRLDLADMLSESNTGGEDDDMDYHAQTLETLLTCVDCVLATHEKPFPSFALEV